MRTKLRRSESSVKTLRISIRQAVSGMIAAVDVYTFNNQLIIAKGTKLTDIIITRLNFYSVTDLYILSEDVKPLPYTVMKKEASHSEVVKDSIEFKHFNEAFEESIQEFKGNLNNIVTSELPLDSSILLAHATSILSESRKDRKSVV